MSKKYGVFELPVIPKMNPGGKWDTGEDDHGAFFLLPNGYVLSIQQRTRGYWDAEDNTAEVAIFTPLPNGELEIDGKIIRGTGEMEDVQGWVTADEAVKLMKRLSTLPQHKNWKDNLGELNAEFPLTPIDSSMILGASNTATVAQPPIDSKPSAISTEARPAVAAVQTPNWISLRDKEKIEVLAREASTPEDVAEAFKRIAAIETAGYHTADKRPRDAALLTLAQKGASAETLALFSKEAAFALRIDVDVDRNLTRISELAAVCPNMLPAVVSEVVSLKDGVTGEGKRTYLGPKVDQLLEYLRK